MQAFVASQLLKDSGLLDDAPVVMNERPFSILGLTEYVPKNACQVLSFIDQAEFIDKLDPAVFSVLLVKQELAETITKCGFTGIVVDNPRNTFFRLHNYLCKDERYLAPEKSNDIDPSARVSSLASIADTGVAIGPHVEIEDFVKIHSGVSIGAHSIIRAGSVIGGTGFEFKRDGDEVFAVLHAGTVAIGAHVEIQNNSNVDRGIYPWSVTTVGDYTKLDSLVYVAHGVEIGKSCLIAGQAVIGGRVVVGERCWIGFGAIIRNGLKMGNDARANMGAVVTRNIADRQAVSGNFAIDHELFLQLQKRKVRPDNG